MTSTITIGTVAAELGIPCRHGVAGIEQVQEPEGFSYKSFP